MNIDICRVRECSSTLIAAFERLLPQLSSSAATPSQEYVEGLLASDNMHLFVAKMEDGAIVGMLSLVVVDIPTGRKAWIEDVVTDSSCRGCGVGKMLVDRAIEEARNTSIKRIYLTSNPSRLAAHALYRKCGFESYDTTVFRRFVGCDSVV